MCPALVRSAEARSRRDCGERGLNDFGTRIRSSASTGTGKSIEASRLTCRSAVSTSGRGPSWWSNPRCPLARPAGSPGSSTSASPANFPVGTWMTSPGFSFSSEEAAAARRCAAPCLASSVSRSLRSRRRRAYSSKSPRWQVMPSL
ncbi:hypothetical protein SCALM49S_00001 [Streptomyces californicus]